MTLRRYTRFRKYGRSLTREQMSSMVKRAVDEYAQNEGPKNAMILAGRLKAIAMMAASDDYWSEQVSKGFDREFFAMTQTEAKR